MLQSRAISEASFTFVSIREFLVVSRACFQIQGFIFRLSFNISSEQLFLFPDLRRRAGQITYALVVPPRDYQLRHLAVIPLRLCLVLDRINFSL